MFRPAQQRQLIGAGVVEVEGSGLWLRWGIAVPLEEEMGCPEPCQIARQLQQPEQIIGTGELHPTPLQPQAAPLDLNNASADQLALLDWPEQRLANLMRERSRAGFKDLADLQERLCLPASSVEALIGRVSFGSRRAGPSLPLP